MFPLLLAFLLLAYLSLRLLRHATHFEVYKEAFSKPINFVIDFGENIAYRNELFDFVLLAETLDHISKIEMVLKESLRVLKRKGSLIIINHLEDNLKIAGKLDGCLKQMKRIKNPIKIFKKAYHRIVVGDHHLQKFTKESLKSIPGTIGFIEHESHYIEKTNQFVIKFLKG